MSTLSTLPSLPQINSAIDAEASAYENPASDYNDPQLDSLIDSSGEVIQTTPSDESNLTIPSVATAGTTPTSSSTPTATTTATAIDAGTGILASLWNIITGNIENGIFVVLGLLLIAAGIFAFKSTQTIVKVAGKAGTTAAELAA